PSSCCARSPSPTAAVCPWGEIWPVVANAVADRHGKYGDRDIAELLSSPISGRVGPVHYCTGPPSGPCMHVPAHTAQASHEGGLDRWLQHGVPAFRCSGVCARAFCCPGTCARTGAGGVYEVYAVTARCVGCGVVDQVFRLDRLFRHPLVPPFPLLGGLG